MGPESTIQGVSDEEIADFRNGRAVQWRIPGTRPPNADRGRNQHSAGRINSAGGVNGRHLLRLVAADDGYEPEKTADAMHLLYDKEKVFSFIDNVGTPTAAVALPFALDHRALFFGAFTGASLLRRDPPWSLRPSTIARAMPKRLKPWCTIW